VLELDDLHRRFGDVQALDGMTFRVPPRTMFGFLGPNGAGKTTAMRAILGVTSLDAGSIRFDGGPVDDRARRRFGYVPEERGLYPSMRVLDQLQYFGRLHDMDAPAARRAGEQLCRRLGLSERLHAKVEELSLGNQQRVQLAAALVHDPELLVLDEPCSGLDPVGVDDLSETLVERAAAGATIVFSSHQLDLVEHLCEEVAIVDHGRLVAFGAVSELAHGGATRLAVRVAGDTAGRWADALPVGARRLSGAADGTVAVGLQPESLSDAVLDAGRAGGRVEQFGTATRRLSEVFREAVGRPVTPASVAAPQPVRR
jgi:ABC-2 type transport system ATP-binding protein